MTELQKLYASKIVILRTDNSYITLEQWQAEKGLSELMIGQYYSFMEKRFTQDIELYGKLIVCEPLMLFEDEFRRLKGKPNKINAFNRSHEHQLELHARGFKAAKFSPHEVFMAADNDTDSDTETIKCVELAEKAADNLGLQIRIGYKEYMEINQTFFHVDVCPMYYAPGKSRHTENHPVQWERETTW